MAAFYSAARNRKGPVPYMPTSPHVSAFNYYCSVSDPSSSSSQYSVFFSDGRKTEESQNEKLFPK